MTTDARNDFENQDPELFCSQYLFGSVPFVFNGDLVGFLNWKAELAAALLVDPHELVFTGSSALGFSLSPYKPLRTFDAGSDIDIAVISHYHFDTAWRFLRNMPSATWLAMSPAAREAIRQHEQRYVYWGTIATDRILQYLPFGRLWITSLATMGKREPTQGRRINARLYRDADCLRAYQVRGIKSLRQQLMEKGGEP